jgi:PAS domain S-box-containing protein
MNETGSSGSNEKRRDLARTIEVLFEISNAVTHTRNLNELYWEIHQSLDKILNVNNFFIALFHEERDSISFPYHVDEKDDLPEEIFHFSETSSLTGKVIQAKKPLIFFEQDLMDFSRKDNREIMGTISKIWLGAPLIIKGRVFGAMVIQDYNSANAYQPQDLDLLNSVSQHVALVIERKEADEKIKDQQSILEKILESSPIGIALVENRVFKWVNGEMVRMFEYNHKQEFQDKSVQMIYMTPKDYESAGRTIHDSLATLGIADYEMYLVKKDGKQFPAQIRLNCADSKDPMARTIAIMIDISQRKAAEKEIYERERLQGVLEMAGAICHEINQPLQAILGYAELMLMSQESDITDNRLKSIKSQATRLGKITKKMSNITQYKTVDYPGNTKIVDIWGADKDTQ